MSLLIAEIRRDPVGFACGLLFTGLTGAALYVVTCFVLAVAPDGWK